MALKTVKMMIISPIWSNNSKTEAQNIVKRGHMGPKLEPQQYGLRTDNMRILGGGVKMVNPGSNCKIQ